MARKRKKPTAAHGDPSGIVRYLRLRPRLRTPALLLLVISGAVISLGLAYVCWLKFLPIVWNWGFSPPSWRGILSFFGGFYLVIIPTLPLWFSRDLIGRIFELYVEDQEKAIRQKLDRLRQPQSGVEAEMEKKDSTGLVPLIRYSRLQLEAYYEIGLSQTQRSFRYSVIAMWIGFIIIVGGIILRLIPTTASKAGELQLITISSGAIIEMISALFLWVYRSSMSQLNYFYNRQMILHSILLCDRLSDAMKEGGDLTKKSIIESVLKHTWEATQPLLQLPSSPRAGEKASESS